MELIWNGKYDDKGRKNAPLKIAQPFQISENASLLTGTDWSYLKIPQSEFEKLQPDQLADLLVFAPASLFS